MEYDEFLTSDEKKQIDELMKKAEERRMKKMEDDASKHFLMLDCQCMCMKMQEKEGKQGQSVPSDCFELMQEFLKMLCNFCRVHGCRECHKKEESVGNEELPFP